MKASLLFAAAAFAAATAVAADAVVPDRMREREDAHKRIVELDRDYRDLAMKRADRTLSPEDKKVLSVKMRENRDLRKEEAGRLFGIGKPIPSAKTTVVDSTAAAPMLGNEPASDVGLYRNERHNFAVRAPQGWVLDTESGQNNGLPAVFYPQGSSWARADAVLYATSYDRGDDTERTLEAFIAADKAVAARRDTGLKTTDRPGLPTSAGAVATVVEYQSDTRHEAVAYLEGKNSFVTLVVSAQTPGAFSLVQPVFIQLVRSYRLNDAAPAAAMAAGTKR